MSRRSMNGRSAIWTFWVCGIFAVFAVVSDLVTGLSWHALPWAFLAGVAFGALWMARVMR